MSKTRWQKSKLLILVGILGLYVLIAGALFAAVSMGILSKSLPTAAEESTSDTLPIVVPVSISTHLQSAQLFLEKSLLKSNGHVDLYTAASRIKVEG